MPDLRFKSAFASVLCKAVLTVNLRTLIFNYEQSTLEYVDDCVAYCCRRGSISVTENNHSAAASASAWHILFVF